MGLKLFEVIKDLPNNKTIAHELGHGAFTLEHPFVEFKGQIKEGHSCNLMDYHSCEPVLNKYQCLPCEMRSIFLWGDLIQDPKSICFTSMLRQEESEAVITNLDDDPTIKAGGSTAIFNYILEKKYDKLTNALINKEDNVTITMPEDLLGDSKVKVCSKIEAKAMIDALRKYVTVKEIIKNRETIYDIVDNNPQITTSEIYSKVGISSLKFSVSDESLKELDKFVQVFIGSTRFRFRGFSLSEMQKLSDLKYNEFLQLTLERKSQLIHGLSNTQFKKFLTNECNIKPGAKMQEYIKIKNEGGIVDEITKRLKSNKRINNNIQTLFEKDRNLGKIREIVNTGKVDSFNKLANRFLNPFKMNLETIDIVSRYSNILLKSAGHIFDMKDVAENLIKSVDGELQFSDLLNFAPFGIGALSWVVEDIINEQRLELQQSFYDEVSFQYLMDWDKNREKFDSYKETTIMIQYVDTGNKRNSKVNGTSIFIEDKELAKEIFGFEPKFVNYELMNNTNDFNHYTEYNPKVYKSYSIEFNIN